MSGGRIFTLRELAAKKGRSRQYWLNECRSGRLSYLQPAGRGGLILVCDEAFNEWVAQAEVSLPGISTGENSLPAEPPPIVFDL